MRWLLQAVRGLCSCPQDFFGDSCFCVSYFSSFGLQKGFVYEACCWTLKCVRLDSCMASVFTYWIVNKTYKQNQCPKNHDSEKRNGNITSLPILKFHNVTTKRMCNVLYTVLDFKTGMIILWSKKRLDRPRFQDGVAILTWYFLKHRLYVNLEWRLKTLNVRDIIL